MRLGPPCAAVAVVIALHVIVLQTDWAGAGEHRLGRAGEDPGIVHLTLIDAPPARLSQEEPTSPSPTEGSAAAGVLRADGTLDRVQSTATEKPTASPGEQEEFVDARFLTLRPAPVELIALPQPGPDDNRDAGNAVFTLFVDREGRVVRVRVDSSTLPEDIERQSRQAFLEAHFRPGAKNGNVVASRLQIELVFDPPGKAARDRNSQPAADVPIP